MKTLILTIVFASFITATRAFAQFTFSYSYNTVYDSNATQYFVQATNVQRYDNWPSDGASEWTPTALYQDGIILQHFSYGGLATSVNLRFDLYKDHTLNNGSAKMEGSIDGLAWTVLGNLGFNDPVGETDYNLNLASDLLGTDLWLRTTLRTEGVAGYDPKFAQFSRSLVPELNPTTPVFSLTAEVVPEPSSTTFFVIGLSIAGIASLARRTKRQLSGDC